MTTFTVIERPQKLEPIAKDPFIEGLPSGGAEDTVARHPRVAQPLRRDGRRMTAHVVRVT
jgi:hypothetical protein